jgi:hypothetical protein
MWSQLIDLSKSVTISNGQSLSGALDLERYTLVGIIMPAGWDAASITFQGSVDGNTWAELWDESSEITLTSPAAGVYILLSPSKYLGVRYLKVRSGTSAAPVNQTADRQLTMVRRSL